TTPAWFQEIYFRPRRFTSSRTCATMLKRAVFSEGAAARPITASQPPGRACKTSKHYRSRLARPLFFKTMHSQIAIVRHSLADVRESAEGKSCSNYWQKSQ